MQALVALIPVDALGLTSPGHHHRRGASRFLELGTEKEREQFKEIFWRDRKSEPESPVNSVREEHYRRLAYATSTCPASPAGKRIVAHLHHLGPPDELSRIPQWHL